MANDNKMVKVFDNREFGQVRTVVINDEPYFVGKDVAEILGYSNTRKALADHVDEEDKGVTKCDVPQTKGKSSYTVDMTTINESGLYSLILSSKLPTAKRFKHWVTSEVLPALRKTGQYSTRPMTQLEVMAGTIQEMIRIDNHCKELQDTSDKHTQQIEEINNKVVNIADAIAAREVTGAWRKDTSAKINQIARSEGCSGDFREDVKVVRHAVYEAVDRRCGVRLYTRLKNRRDRMTEMGIAKTRVAKINIVDEIATDPKLIQSYMDAISDFLIAFPWPEDVPEEV